MGETSKVDSSKWSYIPIVRKADRTFVHYIENIEGVPYKVTMELDKDKEIVKKSAIPLNEIWA